MHRVVVAPKHTVQCGDGAKQTRPSKLSKAAQYQVTTIIVPPECQQPYLGLIVGVAALACDTGIVGLHGSILDLALLRGGGFGLRGLGLRGGGGGLAVGGSWRDNSTGLLADGDDLALLVLEAVGLEAAIKASGTV